MNTDDTDTRLNAEFVAYRERAVPTYSGPGGSSARATVTKRRYRAAIAAVVLIVAAGVGLLRLDHTDEDRLVPVSPPSPSESPSPTYWRPPSGPLDDASIDFSAVPKDDCGGPTVQLVEGHASVDKDDHPFSYYVINEPQPLHVDVTGDGKLDYVARLGCVGEGGGTGRSWVFVVTGDLPDLTVAGPGASYGTPKDTEDVLGITAEGGLVTVTVKRDLNGKVTEHVLRWNDGRWEEQVGASN